MRRFFFLLVFALTASAVRPQITEGSGGFPEVTIETTTPPGELMTPRASSDLVTWEQQAPVTVRADGTVRFTDYGGYLQRRRFYQAVPLPGPGSYLFYERRGTDGSYHVFRCRLDGTQEVCLGIGHYPRPSPNGRWVLVTRDGAGPSFHTGAGIWVIDTEIPSGQACGFAAQRIYNNLTGEDVINYSWEPNNQFFVFDCGGRLYRMTRDGGGRNPLFPTADCVEAMPSMGPAGGDVVFAHRIPSQLVTRPPGGAKTLLTSTGLGDSWPQWSPDGTWIAACDGNTDFSRTDLGHDLLRIDPVSGARTPLTQVPDPGDGFPFGGAVSANGLWVYAAGTVGGVQGVWRVPSSGGAPRAVNITSALTSTIVFIGGIVP
jgi:hypothetical protein